MTDKQILQPGLYVDRGVEETQAIYADWAASYDADVAAHGYVTPGRIAACLADLVPLDTPVLDFGCGTGLAGLALEKAGFSTIDGCDISAEMLKQVPKGLYRHVLPAQPDEVPFPKGQHSAIVAAGVISAGAAPPETLLPLVAYAPAGCVIVFSFNDPTISMGSYDAVLTQVLQRDATLISRTHGPHLPAKGMGSDVIAIQKS